MSQTIWSHIIPLQLLPINPIDLHQYQSIHMDDDFHNSRLNRWQSLPMGRYYQPWQADDVVTLQAQNNAGQLKVALIDCNWKKRDEVQMARKQQNTHNPKFFIYESESTFSAVPDGKYWFMITAGNTPGFIAEPVEVLEDQPGTLLMEYQHRKYYQNFLFETGLVPSLRFKGILRKLTTASKDTLFEDQTLNSLMITSTPYRVWELIIMPIPDWMEDKISRILGCSNLKIDGRYYTKHSEKLEPLETIGNGALTSYRVELRETLNRPGKVFDTDVDTTEEMFMVLNATSRGFADTTTGSSSGIVQFNDIG